MMNIVFLGPPGSGKGTQAKILAQRKNFLHISTGDLFREEIEKKSELGLKVKSFIDEGKLVPDNIVLDVIKRRINLSSNILFDGFPRTVEQAEGLSQMMEEISKKIDIVFFFEISDNEVIKRIVARRSCQKCGRIYNLITNPPLNDEACDICGVKLYQRDDDREDVIKKRLEVYKIQTSPLISYYRLEGIFEVIDASKGVEEIYLELERKIEQKSEKVRGEKR
jgi:adenylate kinase